MPGTQFQGIIVLLKIR